MSWLALILGCGGPSPTDPGTTPFDPDACVTVDAVTQFGGAWQQWPIHTTPLAGAQRVLSIGDGTDLPRSSVITVLDGAGEPEPQQIWAGGSFATLGHRGLTSGGDRVFVGEITDGLLLDAGQPSQRELPGHGIAVVRQGNDDRVVWARLLGDEVLDELDLIDARITDDDHVVVSYRGGRVGNHLVRLDAAGEFVWSQEVGSSAALHMTAMTYDPVSDSVDLALNATGKAELVLGTGAWTLDTAGDEALIARYDREGAVRWVNRVNGSTPRVYHLAAVGDGTVLVSGDFTRAITVGFARESSVSIATRSGAQAGWLARLDRDGDVMWVRQAEVGARSWSSAAAVSRAGDEVVWVGQAGGDLRFGDTPTIQLRTDWVNTFVARFELDGRAVCASSTVFGPVTGDDELVWPTHLAGLEDGRVSLLAAVRGEIEVGTEGDVLSSEDDDAVELLLSLPR